MSDSGLIRFTWGHAVVLFIASFMGFILYFVYRMVRTEVDLVSSGYYESGIKYDERAAKLKNAQELSVKPILKTEPNQVVIVFPHEVKGGSLKLYRPGNKKLDREWMLEPQLNQCSLTTTDLADGYWKWQLEWIDAQNKPYYYEIDWNK